MVQESGAFDERASAVGGHDADADADADAYSGVNEDDGLCGALDHFDVTHDAAAVAVVDAADAATVNGGAAEAAARRESYAMFDDGWLQVMCNV